MIFLSDQDDIWANDKIEIVKKRFDKDVDFVVHSATLVDENLKYICTNKCRTKKITPIRILIKNNVQGCCLAFRRETIDWFMPFPPNIPMHDSWIGMMCSHYGKGVYLNMNLLYYRQHSNNATSRKHKAFIEMLGDRYQLALAYFYRVWIRQRK